MVEKYEFPVFCYIVLESGNHACSVETTAWVWAEEFLTMSAVAAQSDGMHSTERSQTHSCGKPSAATWLSASADTWEPPSMWPWINFRRQESSATASCTFRCVLVSSSFSPHSCLVAIRGWTHSGRIWTLSDVGFRCQLESCCDEMEGQREMKAIHDNKGDSRSQISLPPRESKSHFMGIASRQLLALEQANLHTKITTVEKKFKGAGEVAQWLRAPTALLKGLSSNPSNHMVTHNHL